MFSRDNCSRKISNNQNPKPRQVGAGLSVNKYNSFCKETAIGASQTL
jgi:hypothetical protein